MKSIKSSTLNLLGKAPLPCLAFSLNMRTKFFSQYLFAQSTMLSHSASDSCVNAPVGFILSDSNWSGPVLAIDGKHHGLETSSGICICLNRSLLKAAK